MDDGSQDRTYSVANEQAKSIPSVRVIRQTPNQGKGSAVQRGISEAAGDFVIVQDADLEYDPADYLPMLDALRNHSEGACIYGSRMRHPQQAFGPWLAGAILTLWTFLLYGKWVSDTLTAYKIYPTSVLRTLHVKTKGFETDHELTAKLIRAGLSIIEVPIHYYPRSIGEGKKIGPRDGFKAVWTLLRFRFVD